MRYGMCVQNHQIEFIDEITKMGYDYVECRFNIFAENNREKIEELTSALKRNNIKCEAVNCFIPGSFHLTGEDVDENALSEYIETGMKNLHEINCKTVVFGSGGARRIPDGLEYGKGTEQIIHFLRDIVSPIAGKYGITVTIEPLKSGETNVINTVKDAVNIAEKVSSPYISSLADLYHMYAENETPESLSDFTGKIFHSHIAEVNSRSYPKEGDSYDYSRFIRAMEKVGCTRCSVEGSTENFVEDSKKTIALLKKL